MHLLRNSLEFVAWNDDDGVIQALKHIYRAESAELAAERLEEFATSEWGQQYLTIAPLWRRHWPHVIPFLSNPQEVRKVIYTTNALESVHMRLRKIIKSRSHFPNDKAALKLLYLVLRNITKSWTILPREWKSAMNHFAILFGKRLAAGRGGCPPPARASLIAPPPASRASSLRSCADVALINEFQVAFVLGPLSSMGAPRAEIVMHTADGRTVEDVAADWIARFAAGGIVVEASPIVIDGVAGIVLDSPQQQALMRQVFIVRAEWLYLPRQR